MSHRFAETTVRFRPKNIPVVTGAPEEHLPPSTSHRRDAIVQHTI
jgi:hypothetical protein